jgi:hypothetical protein
MTYRSPPRKRWENAHLVGDQPSQSGTNGSLTKSNPPHGPFKQTPPSTPVLNSTADDATRHLRAGPVLPDEVHPLRLPHRARG